MKKKRFVVGLTGGIATGKTEVLSRLEQLGYPVISSDTLAHECFHQTHPVYQSIVRKWGKAVLNDRREVNRKVLGAWAFKQPEIRRQLEKWIHPFVKRGLQKFVKAHEGIVILDVPLLFEVGWDRWVDAVAVVWCSKPTQLKRLMRRGGLSASEANARILTQGSLLQKRRAADYVISNNGTLAQLDKQMAHWKIRMSKDFQLGRHP